MIQASHSRHTGDAYVNGNPTLLTKAKWFFNLHFLFEFTLYCLAASGMSIIGENTEAALLLLHIQYDATGKPQSRKSDQFRSEVEAIKMISYCVLSSQSGFLLFIFDIDFHYSTIQSSVAW